MKRIDFLSPTLGTPPARIAALVLAGLICLTGCASGPVPPDWQQNSYGALNNFVNASLTGNARQAEQEFAHARGEIASTGRLDLMARAMLVRCATRIAALELGPCTDYEALAQDANQEERTYAAFLAGRWEGLQPAQLPPQYRALLASKGTPAQLTAQLSAIPDPLSRLVAAGILMQANKLSPEGIAIAVNTASSQGWRRPLLIWLGVEAKRADAVGDAALAARVRRQIDLAGSH